MEDVHFCYSKIPHFALALLLSSGIKYPALFLAQAFASPPNSPNSVIDFEIHSGLFVSLVFLWKLLFVVVWLLEIYPLLHIVMVIDMNVNGSNLGWWTSSYFGGSVVLLFIDFLLQPQWNFFALRIGIQFLTAVGLIVLVLIVDKGKHRVFPGEAIETAV